MGEVERICLISDRLHLSTRRGRNVAPEGRFSQTRGFGTLLKRLCVSSNREPPFCFPTSVTEQIHEEESLECDPRWFAPRRGLRGPPDLGNCERAVSHGEGRLSAQSRGIRGLRGQDCRRRLKCEPTGPGGRRNHFRCGHDLDQWKPRHVHGQGKRPSRSRFAPGGTGEAQHEARGAAPRTPSQGGGGLRADCRRTWLSDQSRQGP